MLEQLSNEQLSYLIGFLHGDGHLRKFLPNGRNTYTYYLEITQSEVRNPGILDEIIKLLSPIVKCHKYKGSKPGVYRIRTNNKEFCKEIEQFVPPGNKCECIIPPTKEKWFDKYAYIRGLTDSDGAIGIRRRSHQSPFWTVATSSPEVVKFIQSDIKLLFGVNVKASVSCGNCHNIELSNEKAVIYTRLIYGNATIYLSRKYNRHLDLQKWERTAESLEYWTEYEDNIALDSSLSIEEKAILIGRTKQAVKIRRHRLGATNKWTQDEIKIVKDNNKTVKEKATLLNRSISSIRHKIRRLNNCNKS